MLHEENGKFIYVQRSYTRIDSNIDLRNVQLKKCSLLWGEENSVISTDIETESGAANRADSKTPR